MKQPNSKKQDKKIYSLKRLHLLGQVMEERAIEDNDPLLMKQAQQLKNKKDWFLDRSVSGYRPP